MFGTLRIRLRRVAGGHRREFRAGQKEERSRPRDKCATIIIVKNDKKKDVIYFFDAPSHKKYHEDICTAAKNGTVTGFVTEQKKKKVISVKKLTYE
jgi:hypothetical protein